MFDISELLRHARRVSHNVAVDMGLAEGEYVELNQGAENGEQHVATGESAGQQGGSNSQTDPTNPQNGTGQQGAESGAGQVLEPGEGLSDAGQTGETSAVQDSAATAPAAKGAKKGSTPSGDEAAPVNPFAK